MSKPINDPSIPIATDLTRDIYLIGYDADSDPDLDVKVPIQSVNPIIQQFSFDAAAVTALGVGFLYLDSQGNMRRSGDGDAVLRPRASDQGNIVLNGAGQYGNNNYFPGCIHAPELAFASNAAFKVTSSVGGAQKFPVFAHTAIQFSLYARALDASAVGLYCGAKAFDVEDNFIDSPNYGYKTGTITQLTQPLNTGDVIVHVNDASNFTVGGAWYDQKLVVGEYINAFGTNFGAEGYSRWSVLNSSNDFKIIAVDVAAKTVTLAAPYAMTNGSPATVPVGQSVRQSRATGVGTPRFMAWNTQLRTDMGQSRISAVIGGFNSSGANTRNMFPPGTASWSLELLGLGAGTPVINNIFAGLVPSYIDAAGDMLAQFDGSYQNLRTAGTANLIKKVDL